MARARGRSQNVFFRRENTSDCRRPSKAEKRSVRRKQVDRGGTNKESQEVNRRSETGQTSMGKNGSGAKTNHRSPSNKKRPRRESTPLMGVFLAAGESRKSRFVLTSRVRPRGLRHNARRPWRQRRCPRRSLRPHRRGRGRRGARVARFRGRAPRERAKKCAFRRR